MTENNTPATEAKVVERLEWTLAPHFSGNRQPCMSGDPRDRLSTQRRRDMEDARDAVLSGLRAMGCLLPEEAAALRESIARLGAKADNALQRRDEKARGLDDMAAERDAARAEAAKMLDALGKVIATRPAMGGIVSDLHATCVRIASAALTPPPAAKDTADE